MSDKYAAIAAEQGRFPVRWMCAALGVSVGGFYGAQARKRGRPDARGARDERLRVEIRTVFAEGYERYGAPRVHRALRAAGTRVAKHRVARFMQADHLVARRRRRFVRTTDSTHSDPIAPNLLQRNFTVAAQTALNRIWVSNMTYVPPGTNWRNGIPEARMSQLPKNPLLAALPLRRGSRRISAGSTVDAASGLRRPTTIRSTFVN